jgi:sugar-specific transcriptional regulator TrmB
MIVKPELVKKIKEYFNLNIYETKVWLALLTKGIVSAGETAELSGVPRSRTYDVLESLEKRGFAIVKIGKPVKYIAVEPNTILEKMKSHVMVEAQDKVKSLATLRGTAEYAELEQLHKTGLAPVKSEELSGFMKGRANIMSKMREMFTNAQKEIAIYTSVADFEKKSRVLIPALESAQKRNIKVKMTLAGEAEDVKKINAKHNLRAKQADTKGKFFIADKQEVMFIVNPEHAEEEMAVWLKSPFFTESLDTLCDYHLKKVLQ